MWKKVWNVVYLTFKRFLNLWKTCGKDRDLLTRYLYLPSFSTISQWLFTDFPHSFPQKTARFSTVKYLA